MKFVVTKELLEVIESFKEAKETLQSPENIIGMLGFVASFVLIYFGVLLIG